MNEILNNFVSAREQMEFQREMSNSAHVREVADLKAAGLNPVLSAHTNGASTPSGASDDLSTLLSALQISVGNTAKALGSGSGLPSDDGFQYPEWINAFPDTGTIRIGNFTVPVAFVKYAMKMGYNVSQMTADDWSSLGVNVVPSSAKPSPRVYVRPDGNVFYYDEHGSRTGVGVSPTYGHSARNAERHSFWSRLKRYLKKLDNSEVDWSTIT